MNGRYWYIAIYPNEKEAREAFERFGNRGLRALLFESGLVMGEYIVAVYGTDDEIISANAPTPIDSFAGFMRIQECLIHHVLIDAKNFPSRRLDDILDEISDMQDEW